MDKSILPLGKLPPELAVKLLQNAPLLDPRVIIGPGVGLDCAVITLGDTCLVMKSDPITFASEDIGWYAVQICANDIATTGAVPRWFLSTLLLPEGKTTPDMVERIAEQIFQACREKNISVVGGHTEITYNLDRPILMGTMIGEVPTDQLITPKGAKAGNRLLLTKGVPIEGTAIIAKEFPEKVRNLLGEDAQQNAADYIHNPGISVFLDAQFAIQAGHITAMHDPTEGGLAAALWEMATACGHTLVIQPHNIEIAELSEKLCRAFKLDPLATIASGALLMAVTAEDSRAVCIALEKHGIPCSEIGYIETGDVQVYSETANERTTLPWPQRDEITRLFES
ncbi:MAG: AIR synthase family protein [Anaerolineaceae bacterium]|nr:AIR synthase family protein [Anaerolineaceae bacterium]